jgi:hypothetical protein
MSTFVLDDFLRATEVLEALAEDRTLLTGLTEPQRVALLIAAGRVSRPQRHEVVRTAKAFRRIARKNVQDADRDARASTGIRVARTSPVFVPPPLLEGGTPKPEDAAPPRELGNPRGCYVCKTEFRRLHFFYDSMCTSCGDLNYRKRSQTASLEGRVALITGARIKIGFQAALMMLRAGARVLVTTRFPRDAAARFAREPDFSEFADRLRVYGLDLRHSPSVELFARYLTRTESRLDILINNAAQTVRRPPGFYAHMLDLEMQPDAALPPELRRCSADTKSARPRSPALRASWPPMHTPRASSASAAPARRSASTRRLRCRRSPVRTTTWAAMTSSSRKGRPTPICSRSTCGP